MSSIDLHLHTTASDGRHTPIELVDQVFAAGVSTLAVTDHDTTAALAEVRRAAAAKGMTAIAGIEITAVEDGHDVHVLGYFVRPDDASLAAFLARQREARLARVTAIAERLAALGVPIDVAPLLAVARASSGRSLGRPQVARAMIDAGHATDTRDAFDRWLGAGRPGFVPRHGPSAEQVIGIVHGAGGIASLAHPGKTRIDSRIPHLAAAGLDALEAYHPDHDGQESVRYLGLAEHLGLLVTAGSDYHGDPAHGRAPGSVTLPPAHWARLSDGRL